MNILANFFHHLVDIFTQSAPWLLLGYGIAGFVKVLIPPTFLHRHLGDNSVKSVIKGALFGAPIPLCSCGVIPAALGLRRAGASKASTTSFLIATPETGLDSVSVTYALLGPLMAVIRPIAAITTAIISGLSVMLLENRVTDQSKPTSASQDPIADCCASKSGIEIPENQTSCCSSAKEKTQTKRKLSISSLVSDLWAGLKFTFIDLVKDTSLWLLVGFIMAALIMTIVPAAFLAQWGAGPYAYIIMALIGVPMYICATASTPIAAGLLFAGVSPGAILVFMLIGPATNVATMAIVKQELGKQILFVYVTTIVVIGFLFGLLTDWLAKSLSIDFLPQALGSHEMQTTTTASVSAVVLFVLLINGLVRRYKKSTIENTP
ncbi:MAG: hypothetical protein CSA45_03750 [Gammaproteobacteria bacterium]|nr:MAG: hypothetical protein CSA45_03750 [Gammaproteobacteria bacterium]